MHRLFGRNIVLQMEESELIIIFFNQIFFYSIISHVCEYIVILGMA